MQCPNCRKVEKGQWLYANGCRSHPEFNVDDWVHEEEIYDIGSYPEMVKTLVTLSLPKFSYVTLLCLTCLSCVPNFHVENAYVYVIFAGFWSSLVPIWKLSASSLVRVSN